MKKNSLLYLTLAAALGAVSCSKTDSSTTDPGKGDCALVPVTAFSLTTYGVSVCAGCVKYIGINTYLPFNATLVKEAFNFTQGSTGTGVFAVSFLY